MSTNSQQSKYSLVIGDSKFVWGERTYIMGIVNATPDSFSGDGVLPATGDIQNAVDQALRMEDEGADIIDVGGESTRPPSLYPDAKPVDSDDEIRRVVPIIEALAGRLDVPISIDTRKASVVVAAVDVGAAIANDVSMLGDPEMVGIVASTQVPVIVSHIRQGGHKGYIVQDVLSDLEGSIDQLIAVRVGRSKIIIDPGLGFAKTTEQSLDLMRSIDRIRDDLKLPVLIGSSRKSFIGSVTGEPLEDRLFGTAATIALAIQSGADIVRVHDVKEMVSVVKMSDELVRVVESGAQNG
ncbi:MAG: dihydropteroate synthase [Dehalococcoidia bacterium]|nr:dihydropteroate synthase [Dehalococcoidia bacterium]